MSTAHKEVKEEGLIIFYAKAKESHGSGRCRLERGVVC